jgi:trk system potassium uptake protein TrkA
VHVVIMGCGRVGSALARTLEGLGHSVAIIDRDAAAFRRLSADFAGQQITGVGFDRDTLLEAGIDRAHAFAAVSSGDNSNIIAARVARETFGLDNVVARIYDANRRRSTRSSASPTVATVRWTADQVIRRLLPEGEDTEWRDPSGPGRARRAGLLPRLARPPDHPARGRHRQPGRAADPARRGDAPARRQRPAGGRPAARHGAR